MLAISPIVRLNASVEPVLQLFLFLVRVTFFAFANMLRFCAKVLIGFRNYANSGGGREGFLWKK